MQEYFIEYNEEKICFFVQRKKIKNMNLKVNKEKQVIISIPMKMPIEAAEEFIKQKISWIKKQQAFYDKYANKKESVNFEDGEILYLLGKKYKIKFIQNEENNIIINNNYIEFHVKPKYINDKKYIKNIYNIALKQYAFHTLENLVMKYCKMLKEYNIEIPKIEIKKLKSKWGSCTPSQNKVIFNLSLIKTPMQCIEYVVLHELSHFKYQNHSKSFYKFIEIFMPDWKQRRKLLNDEFTVVI